MANTSAFAGTIRATVLFEDGSAPVSREFVVSANSRFNIAPSANDLFPEARGKTFGVIVESVGGAPAQIVVERAIGEPRTPNAGAAVPQPNRRARCRFPRYNSRTMIGRPCSRGFLAVIVATAALATPAYAQSPTQDERDVVAVVQKMFDAIASCDEAAARAISMPEGRLYRLVTGTDDVVRSSTFDEFSASLGKCGRKMLERMWAPQVRVHKGIATLWAPYDFWLNGAFSHCGIDSFELAKTSEGWKFISGVYTVERTGCAPSPLGPPSASGASR